MHAHTHTHAHTHSDAAHRVHVMAGQGLNLGLGDVANLTQQLLRANSMGADWGKIESATNTSTVWYLR